MVSPRICRCHRSSRCLQNGFTGRVDASFRAVRRRRNLLCLLGRIECTSLPLHPTLLHSKTGAKQELAKESAYRDRADQSIFDGCCPNHDARSICLAFTDVDTKRAVGRNHRDEVAHIAPKSLLRDGDNSFPCPLCLRSASKMVPGRPTVSHRVGCPLRTGYQASTHFFDFVYKLLYM